MRAVFLALTLGAISMTAAVSDAGQAKKDEPKKEPKDPYKELVTVKRWNDAGKKFLDTKEGVWAYRATVAKTGKEYYHLRLSDVMGGVAAKSEIATKDGVWVLVSKGDRIGGDYVCHVTKKE